MWSVREKEELNSFDSFLSKLPIEYIPIVTRDESWNGVTERISNQLRGGIKMHNSTPETDKVMLCGNMDFNIEIRDMLIERGWEEGSNRKKGSFLLEKAFVG